MNLIQIDSEHLSIPDTDYASTIKIPSGEFSKICREFYSLSETLQVSTSNGRVNFSVDGDIGSGTMSMGNSDEGEEQVQVEITDEVDQQFALRYLNMFNKASGLSNYTTLCMHPETPLVVDFDMDTHGHLKFFLAPKISED